MPRKKSTPKPNKKPKKQTKPKKVAPKKVKKQPKGSTTKKKLFKKAQKLPGKPGLYTWLDENGIPIYIGKANNIRKRAKQQITKGKSTKDVDDFRSKAVSPAFKYVQQPGYMEKLEKIAVRTYRPEFNSNLFT